MSKNKSKNYILLIFNFAVSVLLSTNINAVSAESVAHKEQNAHYGNTVIIGKLSNNSSGVWERIRLDMKINGSGLTQVLSSQTLIPEIYNHTKTNSLHPGTSPSSAPINIRKTTLAENTVLEQSARTKHVIQPRTAIALNKYTALGLRLGLGTTTPSSLHVNCILPIFTQAQQKNTLKSTHNSSAQPQLRQNTLAFYGKDLPQTTSRTTELYTQTTNTLTPCTKHIDYLNTPALERGKVEQNNTKKAMINKRINKHIAFFSENPDYLYRVAERAHPYLYHIVETLSKNQLPLEIALLPMVESAYQPTALSPKGAAGLWQIIPSTGKDYDLTQNNQYDERLDILASTQAAIRYLSDLKNHFNGDWLLALAAYNCGQGAIDNAISRNISDGLDTDFWSLGLPEETQEYVPRFLALSHIFANPASYGLKFAPIKNEPYFVKVKIDRETDIEYLANKNFASLVKLINLTYEQFKLLNPGYLNLTLPTKREYTFLLPHANADQLHRLLASITQFMAEPVLQTSHNHHVLL
jgi:soluble lytic murein transglycosylase-like protein